MSLNSKTFATNTLAMTGGLIKTNTFFCKFDVTNEDNSINIIIYQHNYT